MDRPLVADTNHNQTRECSMNDEYSNLAANAICVAAKEAQEACWHAAHCLTEASVLYKPRLFRDGDQWCALLGEDLQIGVCGFGSTPAEAMQDFNRAWNTPIAGKGASA